MDKIIPISDEEEKEILQLIIDNNYYEFMDQYFDLNKVFIPNYFGNRFFRYLMIFETESNGYLYVFIYNGLYPKLELSYLTMEEHIYDEI